MGGTTKFTEQHTWFEIKFITRKWFRKIPLWGSRSAERGLKYRTLTNKKHINLFTQNFETQFCYIFSLVLLLFEMFFSDGFEQCQKQSFFRKWKKRGQTYFRSINISLCTSTYQKCKFSSKFPFQVKFEKTEKTETKVLILTYDVQVKVCEIIIDLKSVWCSDEILSVHFIVQSDSRECLCDTVEFLYRESPSDVWTPVYLENKEKFTTKAYNVKLDDFKVDVENVEFTIKVSKFSGNWIFDLGNNFWIFRLNFCTKVLQKIKLLLKCSILFSSCKYISKV